MQTSKALISLELSDLTKERMREINGDSYISGDIRTYKVVPLANCPVRDIEIHENLKPDSGLCVNSMSTNLGVTYGTTHSTSMQQASNKVFHFPKATTIKDALLVKKVDVNTPYPLWMINRYGLDSFKGNLTHTQSTNIYLDKKTGLFFILFDEAFLNGVAVEDLTSELTIDELELVGVKSGYLHVYSRNLIDITSKNRNSEFYAVKKKLIDAYENLFITQENTTKVICVSVRSMNPDHRVFSNKTLSSVNLLEIVRNNGTAMDLAFVVAAERQGKFYPIKDDGAIVTNEPFFFKRKHADSEISPLRSDKQYQFGDYMDEIEFSKESTLVIPYTDSDYAFIKGVVDRLNSVKMELINFFKSAESRSAEDDCSMTLAIESYNGSSQLLAIENK